MITRRNMLSLLAAPAIVRASSLMRVVPVPDPRTLATYYLELDLDEIDPTKQLRLIGWKVWNAGAPWDVQFHTVNEFEIAG